MQSQNYPTLLKVEMEEIFSDNVFLKFRFRFLYLKQSGSLRLQHFYSKADERKFPSRLLLSKPLLRESDTEVDFKTEDFGEYTYLKMFFKSLKLTFVSMNWGDKEVTLELGAQTRLNERRAEERRHLHEASLSASFSLLLQSCWEGKGCWYRHRILINCLDWSLQYLDV